jgi:hypothetical protein
MEDEEKELILVKFRRADSWRLANYLLLMESVEKIKKQKKCK